MAPARTPARRPADGGDVAKKPAKTKKPAPKPKPAAKAKPAARPSAKVAPKPAKPPAKGAKPEPVKPGAAVKPVRKGITIVTPKPVKKPAPAKPAGGPLLPPSVGRLLDPKAPARRPLIPSGPKASPSRPLGAHGHAEENNAKPVGKSPFGKRDLDGFRQMLLRKRSELVGDVNMMETQALRGQSGSLSNLPQHLAEQGSETYEQSLSLDLAAADRKLIREIDDALKRIEDGTYGLCELTGKPIKRDRLEELPWARYSIEAARELERQSMRAIP